MIIKLTEKECFTIRELLISMANSKYATDEQDKILIKMINQISGIPPFGKPGETEAQRVKRLGQY